MNRKKYAILGIILFVCILVLLCVMNQPQESPRMGIGASFRIESKDCQITITIINDSEKDIHFKPEKLAKLYITRLNEKDDIVIIKEDSYKKNSATLKPKESFKETISLKNLAQGFYNVEIISECVEGTKAKYSGTFEIESTLE